MQEIKQLGNVPWTIEQIKASIPEFLELFSRKPIKDNEGGMKAPHMFATWFMLKQFNPVNVIESGIWKGQGTWLIENTLPNANIFSLDIKLSLRQYVSPKVKYFEQDFSTVDWNFLENKDQTVLFFDDHQSAFDRIKQGEALGFKNFIFEDNYPAKYGDCYSLKKVFQHAGFQPDGTAKKGWRELIKDIIKPPKVNIVPPNAEDAAYLKDVLDVYYEFPPVFKAEKTRWKDNWDESDFPTPAPLYSAVTDEYLRIFEQEAVHYTWICFARVRGMEQRVGM